MSETASTLDRFLDPLADCFTPEVARRIIDLQTADDTRARLDVLRGKANEGTLSSAERLEYEEFVEAFDLMSILKAKAQAVLDNNPG